MKDRETQHDNIIDPSLGFDISYHSITLTPHGTGESLPTGGNLHFHTIPASGTLPHTHEFAEIILILRGAIIHQVNGEIRRLEAGTLCFIRPSDTHNFRPAGEELCEMVILAYQLELMLTLSHFFEKDDFMWRYTEPVLPPTFILSPGDADLLANRILNVRTSPFTPLSAMRTKVKVIVAELFTNYFLEDLSSLTEEKVPEWLAVLCRKMQQPENLALGLKRMQKLACCTPEHLCKCFRKYLNKTPTEYVNELKINYAARKLADGRDEIMAISCDLNFQSLSRFYHLFKQYYGVSPAQYRKNARTRGRVL